MAVLYRTNAQSRALEEAFRRAGVPYRLVGAISFYERREVKDLLAYLRLVANPADNEAFLRAVGVPKRGLGETSLATLDRFASRWGKPLLETARIADRIPDLRPNVREAFRSFAGLIDGAAQLQQLAPADLLEHIIRVVNYEAVLQAEGPEGADRWENVRELVASAANWSEEVPPADDDVGTPLERFLAEAALLSSADTVEGEELGVTLMTLHTAKGLEWPVVVLTGLEHGLFPLARAEEQASGLEEERRLCYVGLTRAKDKLYLTWARARRRGGELRPGIASRFLRAIPPGIVEERRTTSLWAPDWGASGRTGGRADRRSGSLGWTDSRSAIGPSIRPSASVPEEPSQDSPRYVKGERVRHRRFGSGTIQGLIGTGRDLKVSVAFDDEEIGIKQLLVAYAGLEREWESA
jgi:DNA helicase-2/ATP-dependent DNA helicase PcrA